MKWIPIDQPTPDGVDPKWTGVVLLKGSLDPSTLSDDEKSFFPLQPIRVVGYWDSLDGAWALTSTPVVWSLLHSHPLRHLPKEP